jgi:IS1 family transposase
MAVARSSGLIVGAQVVRERSLATLQTFVDTLPPAHIYYTDGFNAYSEVVWPAPHRVAKGKSQTFSIESLNANLRTYLARLKRRSRCFSRSLHALHLTLRLFVWFFNRRQRTYLRAPLLKGSLPLLV